MVFSEPPQTDASLRGVSERSSLGYVGFPKRLLDIVVVSLVIPIALPLMLVAFCLIALDGCNPLFRQPRLGRNGRVYTIFKLRTMIPDADLQLDRHLRSDADARSEWAQLQKLRRDPRITRLGAYLRKSSLDELPQLWNVLKGDMSLVGPRPIMVDQADIYPGLHYYSLRPGITGLWQVTDRNLTSFATRAAQDDVYARRVSLSLDIEILAKTVITVLRGTGC